MPDGPKITALADPPLPAKFIEDRKTKLQKLLECYTDEEYKQNIRKAIECEEEGRDIRHDELISGGRVMHVNEWKPEYGTTFRPNLLDARL